MVRTISGMLPSMGMMQRSATVPPLSSTQAAPLPSDPTVFQDLGDD